MKRFNDGHRCACHSIASGGFSVVLLRGARQRLMAGGRVSQTEKQEGKQD